MLDVNVLEDDGDRGRFSVQLRAFARHRRQVGHVQRITHLPMSKDSEFNSSSSSFVEIIAIVIVVVH